MKKNYMLALKFFTETKNDDQTSLSYKEIEGFLKSYHLFRFYYKFSNKKISKKIFENLSDEEKEILNDEKCKKLIDECKYKICEDIFSEGNYNFELFHHCLEKVFEEERKQKEEEEKRLEAERPKVSFIQSVKNSRFYKFLSFGLILFSVGMIMMHYYMYLPNTPGFK